MKKVLTTVAGTIALALTAGACGPAVDTQETTSTTPIAVSSVKPERIQDELRKQRISRDTVRPTATPSVSAHENHVNHAKLVAAANAAKAKAAAEAKAKRIAKAKAIKAAKLAKYKAQQKKLAQKKAVNSTKKTVKKTYSKVKKVSLSGIAACIAKYESGGNPRAQNPHSSASGLFQFIDGTWRAITGRSDRAKDAPVSVQIAAFYKLWDGGRGAHHWVVAPKCGY